MSRAGGTEGRASGRQLLVAWVHLTVLWAFAVAQPLFGVLADSPEFFVARANTRLDIVVLAVGVTFVPPALLFLVEVLLRPLERLRRAVHLVLVGALTATIVAQLLKDSVGGAGAVVVPVALAAGALLTVVYARWRPASSVLNVLAPAPILFLAVFLLFSPVSKLVLPQGESDALAGGTTDVPIVMLVFDELSGASLLDARGQIDSGRYPNFATLARTSTWFRNATTVADSTTKAVPAILSGTLAERDALPIAADHPQNLFTALGSRYRVRADEPATDLCPTDVCGKEQVASTGRRLRALVDDLSVVFLHRLLPEDLEEDLPAVDRTFGAFRSQARDPAGGSRKGQFSAGIPAVAFQNRIGHFERFLRRVGQPSSRPTLDFLHVELPHVPWQYLPSGQQYALGERDIPGLSGELWSRDEWLPLQAHQRYLLQLAFVDRLLGKLLQRLRDTGQYRDSLVVVTADHGVSFKPGLSRRGASTQTLPDIASVPLFIHAPGQVRGRTDDSRARTIDILPTIADEIGLRLQSPVDGHPLGGPADMTGSLTVFAEHGEPASIPFSEFTRRRDAGVVATARAFGTQGLFAHGGDGDLVGTPVAQLPSATARKTRIALDFGRLLADADPEAQLVPAFVTGELIGADASPGQRLAVGVNGRVAAVTRTYRADDRTRVGAMVPTSALRAGRNEVDFFLIRGRGAQRQFARLGPRDDQAGGYRLVSRHGSEYVKRPSGDDVRVRPGALRGFLEKVSRDGFRLDLTGWAADTRKPKPAQRVLVFGDDELLTVARPSQWRPDLIESLGAALAYSGFRLTTASDQAASIARPGRLRVIALSADRASELKPLSPKTFPARR